MNKLGVKHLLGIKGLDVKDISLIFETADQFKEYHLLEILLLLIYFLKILLVHDYHLN